MSRLFLGLLLLASTGANADQCEAVTPAVAASAKAVLKPGLRHFVQCEPCGETSSGPVKAIREVKVGNFSDELKELTIDGQTVDLAYLFLETDPGSGRFQNVARLTRCPAEGVSSARPITKR